MASIDPLFDRRFNRNNYQCAHFTTEACEYLLGWDLTPAFGGLLRPVKDKYVDLKAMRGFFKSIPNPAHPCVVLMLREGISPHLGLYWKGRILHLTENGVRYEPVEVATMFFTKVRYYVCR